MQRAWIVAVVSLVACGRPPAEGPRAPGEPRASREPGAAVAPALDDAAAIAASQAFMGAVDRQDRAALRAAVGTGFVLFESGRTFDRAALEKMMEKQVGHRPRTRRCAHEQVLRGPGAVVYLGDCTEQLAAAGDHAAESYQGWNTVVLAPEAGAWKVVHWGWQKGGLDLERDMWNDTYRRTAGFRREPNRHLIASLAGRKPGTALDVAMGQGRNAVYLATHGWTTTGIDISDEGLRRAAAAATAAKVPLTTIDHDMDSYDYGSARWDLITMLYAGDDPALIAKLQRAIRPGGLFVLEYFHNDATRGTALGGFDTGELARLFASGWTIVTDAIVDDKADWALGHTKLVRFTAQKR